MLFHVLYNRLKRYYKKNQKNKKMKISRFVPNCASICIALTLVLFFVGCSKSVVLNDNELHLSVGAAPQSLDPHVATGSPEFKIIDALSESLVSINVDTYEVEPAAALSWEESEDGLHYIFNLRSDARWSNGESVTAHDYVYAWRRALMPSIGWQYATDYYYIKNAEAYYKGDITDFNQVGVHAVSDYILKFTLTRPSPLFLKNIAHENKAPILQKELETYGAIDDPSNRWTDAGKYITNGPFRLVTWEINKTIVLEKNPYYWDAKNIKLEKIHYYPIESEAAAERTFRAGQINMDHGGRVPADKIAIYQKEHPDLIKTVNLYGTYFYIFNVTKPPFDDVRVRKALSMTIDREAIVNYITKAGEEIALRLSPPDPSYTPQVKAIETNLEAARKLLAEAGYPNGEGFPVTTVIYNTTDLHRKIAVTLQQMWKKELGIDVELQNQEWKVFLVSRQQLSFSIARGGVLSSLADPEDFLISYMGNHGMNNTGWYNEAYDELLLQAQSEINKDKRFALLAQAENILLDELPIAPMFYYSMSYLIDDSVKGFRANALDRINYKDFYIE